MSTDFQAAVVTPLLNTVSAANTGAATGAWVAIPANTEGDIEFLQHIGAVTGSIAGAIQTADDNSGTNAATITFNEGAFTSVSSANSALRRTVDRKALSSYVKYTGTVVTGPALVSVTMQTRPKYI